MIPQGAIDLEDGVVEVEDVEETSRTYKLDFKNNRLTGLIVDGLEAVKQAVIVILLTDRYRYPIYDDSHGVELVPGEDRITFEIETKQRIEEALLQDDRITTVDSFEFEYSDDSALIRFTVHTRYGDFNESKVVEKYV